MKLINFVEPTTNLYMYCKLIIPFCAFHFFLDSANLDEDCPSEGKIEKEIETIDYIDK